MSFLFGETFFHLNSIELLPVLCCCVGKSIDGLAFTRIKVNKSWIAPDHTERWQISDTFIGMNLSICLSVCDDFGVKIERKGKKERDSIIDFMLKLMLYKAWFCAPFFPLSIGHCWIHTPVAGCACDCLYSEVHLVQICILTRTHAPNCLIQLFARVQS